MRILIIAVLIYSSTNSFAQSEKDSVWIQTIDGCKVYNPHPISHETITWTGECSNGYATGIGTLKWYKNGKENGQYLGQMKRGIAHGKGRYEFSNGSIAEGEYTNGELEGLGKEVLKDNSNRITYIYQGEFKNGDRDGYGEEIDFFENGDTAFFYRGYFKKSKRHGEGFLKEYNFSSKDSVLSVIHVKGSFTENYPQGKVEMWHFILNTLYYYYIGDLKKGARDGYGEELSGAIKYLGEWRDDFKKGKGRLMMDSLVIYEGQWDNDKFNGLGKRFYPDGSWYCGEFKNNNRDGFGAIYWKNGTAYVGEFSKDLYSGSGYMFDKQNNIVGGIWRNGNLTIQNRDIDLKKSIKEKYKAIIDEFKVNLGPD